MVPATAGKKESKPIYGLGKAKISKIAIPIIENKTTFFISLFAIFSLSRAALYAPTGVRVNLYSCVEYFSFSIRDICSISVVAFLAKAVSVPEAIGLAINRRCLPSADKSCPLYAFAFCDGKRYDNPARIIFLNSRGSVAMRFECPIQSRLRRRE